MNKLTKIVGKFKDKKVLIVGDVMLDEYRWGQVTRISQEAPVPIVEIESSTYVPGGAANTAANVSSLGGDVYLFGVVGEDFPAKRLVSTLESLDLKTEGLITDSGRPTTLKTRIMAHNQQLFRIDRESKELIARGIENEILGQVEKIIGQMRVVVISDYAKGVVTPRLSEEIIKLANSSGIPVVVDPKGSDFRKYAEATIITPNKKEAFIASGVEIIDQESLGKSMEILFGIMGCEAVLLTRSEEGMTLVEKEEILKPLNFPALAKEVFDVSGAGDTVVAALALSLAAGGNFSETTEIANYAASVAVGKLGTSTVTMGELMEVLK